MRWVFLGAILTIAVLRCVVVMAPYTVFDVDPAFDPSQLAALGKGGSLLLDMLLLIACAMSLLAQWRTGRGINWPFLLLALIPAPVIFWHGFSDATDLWKGSTLLAASVACVTIAHLCRDKMMKIVIVSLLLAVVAPLLVRGAAQLTYEHTELIEAFEANKQRVFAMNGWEADSPSARIYERRLRQAQPLGWFPTTNIFASLMTLAFSGLLGVLIAGAKAKVPSGWLAVVGVALAGAGYGLFRSGSLGAMVATLAGVGLLMLPMVLGWSSSVLKRFGGALVILMLLGTLAGVVVRGGMLSEGFAGDKSLLFRWHYLQASAEMFKAEPLVGVGPGGYQEAYTRHRVARNPEEVISAHSMFVDWLTGMGISALAWIALVGAMLIKAGGVLSSKPETLEPQGEGDALKLLTLLNAMVIVVIGLGLGMFIELAVSLDPLIVLLRVGGAVGFVLLATIMTQIMLKCDLRIVQWSLLAGVAALLVHSQIEMTFAQPGAVVWAMLAVGTVGRLGSSTKSRPVLVLIAMVAGSAIWIGVTGALPALRQTAVMNEGAELLRDFPRDVPSRIALRRAVAAKLIEAHEIMPSHAFPRERAVQQLTFGAGRVQGSERAAIMNEALKLTEYEDMPERTFMISLRANILFELARFEGSEKSWERAIGEMKRLTQRDPQSNNTWKRLGNVLWESGRVVEARAAYRRALQADDDFELDPMKQLSSRDREMIEQRIGGKND